jgi:hypothetical protein
MAKPNAYLAKQAAINHGYFEAGLQMGRQQILDMMSIVLNNPKYVKKDVFGRDRLLIVIKGIGENIDTFQKAWECDNETDYYRSKLDAILSEIYGEEMHDTFDKRYEYCCDYDYVKGKWKR